MAKAEELCVLLLYDFYKSDRAAFTREVQEAQASQQDSDIRKKRRRLAAAQKRAVELTPEEQKSFYSEVFNLLQIRD